MDSSIQSRLDRLYVALGRTIERDIHKRPAQVVVTEQSYFMYQDFSGGQSHAELSETLHSLIHNVASFHDHLQEWGSRNGIGQGVIHAYFKNSNDFCVVRDLWNNDKHGPPDREGWSKLAPTITDIRSCCQLRTQAVKGSSVALQIDLNGRSIVSGDGTAEVVITGAVLDKNGNGIGSIERILDKAISVCEPALAHFKVS